MCGRTDEEGVEVGLAADRHGTRIYSTRNRPPFVFVTCIVKEDEALLVVVVLLVGGGEMQLSWSSGDDALCPSRKDWRIIQCFCELGTTTQQPSPNAKLATWTLVKIVIRNYCFVGCSL